MNYRVKKFLQHLTRSIAKHCDIVTWQCKTVLEKYHGDFTGMDILEGRAGKPYEIIKSDGNLLTTVGATAIWTDITGGSITEFSNANSYIGVGDGNGSVPTPAAGDTDLTAPTNKLRKAMDATFPSIASATVTFKSTFATGDANFAWREWGVFNASSSGTMLNHKGEALGTKVSTATWAFSCALTLA